MPRLPLAAFTPDCTIQVDGVPVPARAGEPVAVALLAAGRALVARSAKYHRPRGPFCLSGSCHRCLARVDGVPNERTCRVPCRPGLVVESQNALPSARHDLLGAVDAVFPGGLDHHHLATWNGLANRAAVAFARQLAGLGRVADRPPPPAPEAESEDWDAVIVGAGPAGLAAAEVLAAAGRRVLVADGEPRVGGRLRCALRAPADPGPEWPGQVTAAVRQAGGEVATRLTGIGFYGEGAARTLLLRSDDGPRVRVVRGPRVLLATGTSALPPLVPQADLPGVLDLRGLARALAEHGLLPGRRAVVAGRGLDADRLAELLWKGGLEVRPTPELRELSGTHGVRAARLSSGERVRCDVAVVDGRAPASELARQAGAACAPDPRGGWAPRALEAGRLGPGLWAAGELLAPCDPAGAAASGRAAGEDMAR